MKTEKTPEINLSNYEEYFLLSLDGELDAETENALFSFLDAHPQLTETVAAYEATKIPFPENSLVFEDKESLLKPEETVRKVWPFKPFIWSAAALVLLWIGTRMIPDFPEKAPQTAFVPKDIQPIQTPTAAKTPVFGEPQLAQRAQPKTPEIPEIKSSSKTQLPTAAPKENPVSIAVLPKEDIVLLPMAETALFPENPPLFVAVTTIPVLLNTPTPRKPEGIEISIPAVDALREAAAEKIVALRDVRHKLKDTEATLIIGNRELFTIRF